MKLSRSARESIDKVITRFQQGDLSPITQVARIKPDPKMPILTWSLSNMVLAFSQAHEIDCRSFRQWQKVGRHVKKGSKAIYIIRPRTVKNARIKESDDTQEKYVCVGFSAFPVFAVSDTEGESASVSYQPQELLPLIDVARKLGIAVAYVPIIGEQLGDVDPKGKKIRLGSQDPSVFFHELAHAIHARIDGPLKGGQHVDQETVAELTAAVLMDLYGFRDHSGNAWQYISRYSDDPLLALTKALGTVEKVLAVLFEHQGEQL